MINKEGKLFGKISIIDIVAVLLIAIAALGIYLRFFVGNEKVETSLSKIEYTMKVSEVRIGTVNALEKFMGPVTSASTKEYMGDIIEVSSQPAERAFDTANGTLKVDAVPDRYNVYIKVLVDGSVNDRGFYTGTNQSISVGSSHTFTTKAAKTSGLVIDVHEVK